MKFHKILGLFGTLALFNACSSVKGDDFIKEQVKKIDIVGASSLAVTKASIGNRRQLVKFSDETTDAETVNFLDKDGKPINVNFAYISLYNIENSVYSVTCVGLSSNADVCYLVNKSNGDAYILADKETDQSNFPKTNNYYFKNQKVFKTQVGNYIYYLSSSEAIKQIDVSDINNLKLVKLSLDTETVNEFVVNSNGDLASIFRDSEISNSQRSKILFSDGHKIYPYFTDVWTDSAQNILVSNYDEEQQGTAIKKLEGIELSQVSLVLQKSISIFGNYIFNIVKQDQEKATILFDVEQGELIELVSDSGNIAVYLVSLNGKINTVDFKNNWLFVALDHTPRIIAFDFENEAYAPLELGDVFDNYNIRTMMVTNENEIMFSAELVNEETTIVNAIYKDGEIMILDSITNPIETLIKIN